MLVRIGTISQGKIKCDKCGQTVVYADRYLIVKEKNGVEDEENGEVKRYCVKCATEKGYVQTRQEKGERILTFFQAAEKGLEPVEPVEPAESVEPVVSPEEKVEDAEENEGNG
jgi:ribosomal protein S26